MKKNNVKKNKICVTYDSILKILKFLRNSRVFKKV